MSEALYLKQLKLGPMDNFVYLIGPRDSAETLVVDPAWDVEAIERALVEDGRSLSGVFLSHCHGDHTNGVPELLSHHDVPVYAQKAEADFSADLRAKAGDALRTLSPGERLDVGPSSFKALHTPGHTPGSQCLWIEDAVVSGDTVFVNGCGRCDLPGGNPEEMYRTLSQVLLQLPDETRLLPGHDYGDVQISRLGRERERNPYFQHHDLQSFVTQRMRPRS